MQRRHFLVAGFAAAVGVAAVWPSPTPPLLHSDGWVPVDATAEPDLKRFFRDHNLTIVRGQGADGVLASSEFWSAYPLSVLKPGRYTLLRHELNRDAYDSEILFALDKSIFKTVGVHLGHIAALATLQLDGSRGMLPIDKKALFYVEGSPKPLCLEMDQRHFADGFPVWNAVPCRKDSLPRTRGTKIYRLHTA